MIALIGWILACTSGKGSPPAEEEEDTAGAGGGEETAEPESGAPPAETADLKDETAEPADTADAGDSGDTGEEGCGVATFTGADGVASDMTSVFTAGEYVTLSEPGTLTFCPGEWYVRLTIEADVSVIGLGKALEETVLSGGESGTILRVIGGSSVSVENVTLSRGLSPGMGDASRGGGVRCGGDSAVSLADVLLIDNEADDGAGLFAERCRLDLERVDFVSNLGRDDGGALGLREAEAALRDVLFLENSARDGGAIASYLSTVDIEDGLFELNAGLYYAGALWNYESTAAVRSTSFLDNTVTEEGGAIWTFGALMLEDVRFEGNIAGSGGALYYYCSPDNLLEGASCDFVDNAPEDIRTASPSTYLTLGKSASFVCGATGCVTK